MTNTLIVKMIFGSHLYGTETPESDQDFKGIYMPSKREIYLNKIKKSIQENTKHNNLTKNTCEDKDYEIYSLHYFINMACKGETATLDMLHAPNSMILETSDLWKDVVKNRSRFYTKNLSALIGYARRQASKYGVKGSRLNDAKRVLDYCKETMHIDGSGKKLKELWNELPTGEHIFTHLPDVNGGRMYEVCGRKTGETCTIQQLFDVVKLFHDNYGERAKKAALDIGIDWKAVSHALRAAYQIREILIDNTITFPLKEAGFIKEVKTGKWKFKNVQPILDDLMNEVELLSSKSKLPESVDVSWWNAYVVYAVDQYIKTGSVNYETYIY